MAPHRQGLQQPLQWSCCCHSRWLDGQREEYTRTRLDEQHSEGEEFTNVNFNFTHSCLSLYSRLESTLCVFTHCWSHKSRAHVRPLHPKRCHAPRHEHHMQRFLLACRAMWWWERQPWGRVGELLIQSRLHEFTAHAHTWLHILLSECRAVVQHMPLPDQRCLPMS